ncbi:hypothetical protein U14_02177 [Candidatus Moduliflexus flocculans]|uniref:Uncharacterized protein n=1 Tax=Candidatus Moduliflexus flocculans TaxID=1499966 RepID=A0A0S6VU03_9BACT|nr:hypothetical protein U14_02177 [Candidatus Moduliflexus flocculans]
MFIRYDIFIQAAINFRPLILDKHFLQIASPASFHHDSEFQITRKNLDKIR